MKHTKRILGLFILIFAVVLAVSASGCVADDKPTRNQAYDAYNAGDYGTAFTIFKDLAENGDSEAMYWLGYLYEKGYGTPNDGKKALEWYQKAVDAGNRYAMIFLGFMYYSWGIENPAGSAEQEENFAKSFEWYQKAADAGEPAVARWIGESYEKGIGTAKDGKKAMEWYLKAAENGDAEAMFCLGGCYEHGIGTAKDDEKAFEWYLKAAEAGSIYAMTKVVSCYRYGIGTPVDFLKETTWMNKIAADVA